jgi:hypothetical protein
MASKQLHPLCRRDPEAPDEEGNRPRQATAATAAAAPTPRTSTSENNADGNISSSKNEYVLHFAFSSFLVFVLFQAVFAYCVAHSQSMMADSEAMSVDALTYLFNSCAERIKNRNNSVNAARCSDTAEEEEEDAANTTERDVLRRQRREQRKQRELQRLYLELIPPLLSVVTLIAVTVVTVREALRTLSALLLPFLRTDGDALAVDAGGAFAGGGQQEVQEEGGVSVPIMLFFSTANLLLDVVNVTCFARVNATTFGLNMMVGPQMQRSRRRRNEKSSHLDQQRSSAAELSSVDDGGGGGNSDETTPLLVSSTHRQCPTETGRKTLLPAATERRKETTPVGQHEDHDEAEEGRDVLIFHGNNPKQDQQHRDEVNLNMCSAWTVGSKRQKLFRLLLLLLLLENQMSLNDIFGGLPLFLFVYMISPWFLLFFLSCFIFFRFFLTHKNVIPHTQYLDSQYYRLKIGASSSPTTTHDNSTYVPIPCGVRQS